MMLGEPVRGILHSTDASAGVEVPLFIRGSTTSRVVAANEYLVIDSAEIVTAAGGDSYLLIGPDASLGTGETIVRGTYAANGGAVIGPHSNRAGPTAGKPFAVAPAGAMDVVLTGYVMKAQTEGLRPTWKGSLIPGA